MTRFTGPLKVKQAFSETTVASIDENGNMQIDGAFVADGGMSAKSTGNFVGPISSGSAAATGFVVLAQQTTIVANTEKVQIAQLPEGSDLMDVQLFVKTAFGTAAADVVVRVGTSAAETAFGTISIDTNIATGMHRIMGATFVSAGTQWTNLNGAGAVIHAAVTAVSGAVASGAEGIMTVTYIHKV